MALATSATDNLSGIKLLTVHEEVYRLCTCAYGSVVEGQVIVANSKEVESRTHTQRNNVDSVSERFCQTVRVFNLDFYAVRAYRKVRGHVKRFLSLRNVYSSHSYTTDKDSTYASAIIFSVLVNRGIGKAHLSRTIVRDREASVFQEVFHRHKIFVGSLS